MNLTKPDRLVLAILVVAIIESAAATRGLMPQIFYLAPGLILMGLYHLKGADKTSFFVKSTTAQIIGLLVGGYSLRFTFTVGAMIIAQAVISAILLQRLRPDGLDLKKIASIASITIVTFGVSAVAGLVLSQIVDISTLAISTGRLAQGATQLTFTDRIAMIGTWGVLPMALGVLLTAPLVSCFLTDCDVMPKNWGFERIALLAFNALASATVFLVEDQNALFLFTPPLVFIALRLGIRDTALATLFAALLASIGTSAGLGPVPVRLDTFFDQQLYLQGLFACSFACLIPIAATIETRRQLENTLAANLDYTDQIIRNMHEIVFRTDANGVWTFLNSAWEEVTGYTKEESIGWKTTRLLTPADLVKAQAEYPRLISGETDQLLLKQQFIRKNGEIRDIEVNIQGLRNADGSFKGTLGTIRDTTESQRRMRSLEQSEQRFRELCDMAPIGIVGVNPEGITTYVNQCFEWIALRPGETIIGQFWFDALQVTSLHIQQEIEQQLTAPGAVYEHELQFKDGAGRAKWMVIVITAEFASDGRLTGYIATAADITEKKRAEEELSQTSRELSVLAENISDVVMRFGLDGTCLYVTPSVYPVLGHDPANVVGANALIRIHPEDEMGVLDIFGQLSRGEIDLATVSYRYLPAFDDADYIWLEANACLLRDEHTNPCEIVATLRDVSARKELELDLTTARQKAEVAAEAKSAFLANFSHEIRTPMNGVLGMTELLLEQELDPVSRGYAQVISESGETMMTLLNDILDLAKIESGHMPIASDPFNLQHVLQSSVSLISAGAARKGLKLSMTMDPRLEKNLLGDSLRLRQILSNLLGNALKFTAKGSISLDAALVDKHLEIRVKDTGIGVSQDSIVQVFDEFFQAGPQVSDKYGGTGLGLPISQRLARAMGGSLIMESQLGKGTTLILTLPASFANARAAPPPGPHKPAPPKQIKNLSILVVEDNRTNQIIILGMLKRLGHNAILAQDGEDALEIIKQATDDGKRFDLVLMDIFMPRLDGISATRQLRKMGHDQTQLPIIAVTANAFPEDVQKCLDAGMQGHISKPVRLAELDNSIRQIAGFADQG